MREIFLQDKIYLKCASTSTSTSTAPDISNPSLTLIPMTRNLLTQFTLYFEALIKHRFYFEKLNQIFLRNVLCYLIHLTASNDFVFQFDYIK